MGPREHLDWRGTTRSNKSRRTQSAVLGQIDLNAPSQPWIDQKLKLVKITPKLHFSCSNIKPEFLGYFCQFWPILTQCWPLRALETLILIQPLE